MPKKSEIDGIPVVSERPDGYLTSHEFAAVVGHTPQTVMYAYRRGRFKRGKLLWWAKPGSAQEALLIPEDQIQPYKANCRLSKPGPKSKKQATVAIPDPSNESSGIKLRPITEEEYERLADRDPMEINDPVLVKLLNEQLKAKRAKLELQRAQNELLDVSTVADEWSMLAIQIRQSILSIIPRVAPRVAAEKDLHKCREILQVEFNDALSELSNFGEKYDK